MSNPLDKSIHQPIRTRLMAYLANVKQCDYVTLKKALALSDGHMSTHMKALMAKGYVAASKTFVQNKPRTTYWMTSRGLKAFLDYIEALKNIIILKPRKN